MFAQTYEIEIIIYSDTCYVLFSAFIVANLNFSTFTPGASFVLTGGNNILTKKYRKTPTLNDLF